MKWRWTNWRRVLALVAVLGLCSLGAQADNIGRLEKQDLKGQFGFNLTEVRCLLSGGVGHCDVEFCPHSGTLSFDGVGMVTIYEVRQCPDEIPQGTFRTYSYSVASDGSFVVRGLDSSARPGVGTPSTGSSGRRRVHHLRGCRPDLSRWGGGVAWAARHLTTG